MNKKSSLIKSSLIILGIILLVAFLIVIIFVFPIKLPQESISVKHIDMNKVADINCVDYVNGGGYCSRG